MFAKWLYGTCIYTELFIQGTYLSLLIIRKCSYSHITTWWPGHIIRAWFLVRYREVTPPATYSSIFLTYIFRGLRVSRIKVSNVAITKFGSNGLFMAIFVGHLGCLNPGGYGHITVRINRYIIPNQSTDWGIIFWFDTSPHQSTCILNWLHLTDLYTIIMNIVCAFRACVVYEFDARAYLLIQNWHTLTGWILHMWHRYTSLLYSAIVNSYSASRDNWCTVGGDGGCRVGEVRAGTTSPMPDHKGFKLQ